MKLEVTFKEGFYFLPAFMDNAFCWLFFIVWYDKPFKTKGYYTPFISLSWAKKRIQLWFVFKRKGYVINFQNKKKISKVVVN